MDFFEHQEAARRKTKLLIFYFFLAVLLIVTALNLVVFFALAANSFDALSQNSSDIFSQIGYWFKNPAFYFTTIATLSLIALGSLFRWLQLRGGGKSVARMVGAREVLPDTGDHLERRFINVVEEMSIASGMPVPTLYIMDEEEAINAFVAGQESTDTIMVVTRGALEQLNRQELQGVVAHEFSHIFNADMKINVRLISILAGILVLGQAGYFVMRTVRHGNISRSNNKESGGIIAAVVVIGLSMYIIGSIGLFFGRLIKAAVSRQREFLADASAIQYARDNQGLAGAFIKIAEQSSLLESRYAEETSHMCIAESMKLNFSGLATHPPIEQRLEAIMPDWRDFRHSQARKSERNQQRQQDAAAREDAANAKKGFDKFGGHTVLAGMGGLLDTIGNPSTLNVHAANALLLAMPEVLKTAAHNHHSSSHAMHLVLALLLSDNGHIEDSALELIENFYNDESREEVLRLANHMNDENRYLRLAIIDIATPSLRRLSKTERKSFLALLKQVTHLDKEVSQFEFVLYSLVHKNLIALGSGSKSTIRKLKPVESEIRLIMSAIVHASGNNNDEKESAYRSLMMGLETQSSELQSQNFDAEGFHNALLKLNRITPMLKKSVLSSFYDAICHDGKITVEEVEMFRAIAECLDCPIPATIQNFSEVEAKKKIKH